MTSSARHYPCPIWPLLYDGFKGRNTTCMTSIGEILRRERMKRNLELVQIAQELQNLVEIPGSHRSGNSSTSCRAASSPGASLSSTPVCWVSTKRELPANCCAHSIRRRRSRSSSRRPRPAIPRSACRASRVGGGWQKPLPLVVVALRRGAGGGRDAGVLGFVCLVAAHAPSGARA